VGNDHELIGGCVVALKRTQYLNLNTGTVRSGATGHGESLTDMESFLIPLDRARGSSLHSWGVADGLTVTATPGSAELAISMGTALDLAGQTIALVNGGFAIVDPNADPNQQQNIATVPVTSSGVAMAVSGPAGDYVLTVTWREVQDDQQPNAPLLVHAPWLRMLPVAGFQDVGEQVVLAQVTLDGAGKVTGLLPGPRRVVGVGVGRLELRCLRTGVAPSLSIDQNAAAELRARPGGGADLNLLSGPTPQTAKQFVIDHPLDPENKYLVHSSIESSERVNIYSGNVLLDDNAEALVQLPDWVEALNKDFRYQVTCVGKPAPVYIKEEISEGSFTIAGGMPNVKVSWQLTGVRDDSWARTNQFKVEEEKPDNEKGFFRNPQLFGQNFARSIHYARNEELIRRNPRIAKRITRPSDPASKA
jgi:hypothetical protein